MKWVADLAPRGGRLEGSSLHVLLFAVEQTLHHPVQVSGKDILHAGNAITVGSIRQEKEPEEERIPAVPHKCTRVVTSPRS